MVDPLALFSDKRILVPRHDARNRRIFISPGFAKFTQYPSTFFAQASSHPDELLGEKNGGGERWDGCVSNQRALTSLGGHLGFRWDRELVH